ncbi:hybrid sensor histidine kinase/response regulator [Pseudomonas sp. PLB05]|uniref:hybrid sensor histidine kinase/response regulator n=1 Tax=Pseudomonas sp. PLB05 TaxID=2899078 RepID=UPI001E496032|nr:ATP-binding protein [Pseudomonas sp. PLB05]MCD4863558.1 response regulator [Pseudomonas sp. PLB05]
MPPTKPRPAHLVPLRNRLLAIAFAGIVPLALVAGLGLWLLVHHQQHEAEQRALESSRQAATTIESELRRSATILQALAESPLLAAGDREGFATLVERVLPLVPGWRTVLLATPDGQVIKRISSVKRAPGGPVAEPDSFAEVVAKRRPVVGQLGRGSSGLLAFPIRVPVLREGQLSFVLTAVMTPESIRAARMARALPKDWVGSVFDRHGLRIARTNLHEESLGEPALPGLAAILAQPGEEGIGTARTREGHQVYTAFVRLPDSGWTVTTAIPTEEVAAAANRSFALYGGGLVLSVAFAWAVALLLSRRISQPVQALQEAAQALGRRQPPVLPDSDVLEIRQVGEALQEAADARRLLEEERDDYLRGLQLSQEQLQLQVADLEVLQQLNHRLLQLPSLSQQLQEIVEVLCRFHQTSKGCVSLLEDGKPPQLYFAAGFSAEDQAQLATLPLAESACAAAVRSGTRIVVPALATAPEFAALGALGQHLGFSALHAVPLRSTLHGILGAITVHLPEAREPTPRQQRLADLCASKAVLVIDRARIQKAALRSQRRLRVALESSQVSFGIAVPAAEGTFAWDYLNPIGTTTLGLDSRDANARLPWASAHILQLCADHQAEEVAWSVELQGPDAQGASCWLQIGATPFDGNVAVWFLDISERKRQEQQLRDNDRQKDEFLAVLAHELRNPLAPIRHAAALIAAPQASPEQQQRSCQTIERQVERMGALLNDLLDISRITFGRITLHNTFVTLQSVLEAAADAALAPMEDKRQRFDLHLPEAPLWLYADPLRLEQIFVNLLGNAARYTPEGGRIVLAVSTGDEVRVEIADNGIGIAPERLSDLFQMFGQIDPRLAERSPGLGIGLALSRELARLQGGDIAATSAGLGQGSRFTVNLPLTVAPPATEQEAVAAASAAPATRRILVADDNSDIADTIAELLELDGHEVRVAYDGQQALTLFQRYGPEIVISDIGMPGLTGHQLARAIRETPAGQTVKLIAMTGWGQAQDKAEALAAGFDHHLTKPADMQTLYALVGA